MTIHSQGHINIPLKATVSPQGHINISLSSTVSLHRQTARMSRLVCTAVLILTILLSSSLIFQVHAICKCDNTGQGPCFECSCENDTCQLLNQITNVQRCKKDLDPSSFCMTEKSCKGPGCSCGDERCSKCDCKVAEDKCKQMNESCITWRDRSLQQCCNLRTAIASCRVTDDCDSCEEGEDCGDDTSESSMQTIVIIAVLVSLVVIILITIASVTLICYWRYKLKLTRETLSLTTHKGMQGNVAYNVGQHNQIPNDDPLYSVLDGEASNCCTHPQAFPAVSPHDIQSPQLPTSRRPYYEEIESDFKETATAIPTEYEQPIKATTTKTLLEPFTASSKNKKGMDDYQEPADAQKVTPQEEGEKQDSQKTITTYEMSAYQEPLDALRADNSLPSQEKEEKIKAD